MAIVFPHHRLLDLTAIAPEYRWDAARAYRTETNPNALHDLATEIEAIGGHDIAARMRARAQGLRARP